MKLATRRTQFKKCFYFESLYLLLGDIYIYMVAPPPGTYLFQFYTLFTVFKASPVKGFEGTGIPYSL